MGADRCPEDMLCNMAGTGRWRVLGRRAPARYIWVGAFVVLGDRCATSVPAGYALAGISAVSVGSTYGAGIAEERGEKEVENGENWRLP